MDHLETNGSDRRFHSRPFDQLVHPVWAGSRLLVVPRAGVQDRSSAQRQSMDIGQNDESIRDETSGNEKKADDVDRPTEIRSVLEYQISESNHDNFNKA